MNNIQKNFKREIKEFEKKKRSIGEKKLQEIFILVKK